jgi:hypothetical protein
MPWAGFEPVIPATEWPQTYALDRVATGTGMSLYISPIYSGILCIISYKELLYIVYRVQLLKFEVFVQGKKDNNYGEKVKCNPLAVGIIEMAYFTWQPAT